MGKKSKSNFKITTEDNNYYWIRFNNLTRACQGLSLERIRRVLSKIIATHKTIDKNSIEILLSEKKQIISQTEILEYWSVTDKITSIGGVENLKEWLKKRRTSFSIQA